MTPASPRDGQLSWRGDGPATWPRRKAKRSDAPHAPCAATVRRGELAAARPSWSDRVHLREMSANQAKPAASCRVHGGRSIRSNAVRETFRLSRLRVLFLAMGRLHPRARIGSVRVRTGTEVYSAEAPPPPDASTPQVTCTHSCRPHNPPTRGSPQRPRTERSRAHPMSIRPVTLRSESKRWTMWPMIRWTCAHVEGANPTGRRTEQPARRAVKHAHS